MGERAPKSEKQIFKFFHIVLEVYRCCAFILGGQLGERIRQVDWKDVSTKESCDQGRWRRRPPSNPGILRHQAKSVRSIDHLLRSIPKTLRDSPSSQKDWLAGCG